VITESNLSHSLIVRSLSGDVALFVHPCTVVSSIALMGRSASALECDLFSHVHLFAIRIGLAIPQEGMLVSGAHPPRALSPLRNPDHGPLAQMK
jgi:hypothetical protein